MRDALQALRDAGVSMPEATLRAVADQHHGRLRPAAPEEDSR